MSDEFLGDRKKALEESFFAKENARLLQRLREDQAKKAAKQGLVETSGIADSEVLDKLVELDIGPDTWAALSLAPLVEVAWANGKVEDKERKAVLSAAEANGIAVGSPSHELLESWLRNRPDGRLLTAWGETIVAMSAKLDDADRERLKQEILGRARAVAEAAGGFLGITNKVSPEEGVVLKQLEKSFER